MNIFWFRRDLRLEDNTALANALSSNNAILPIFIFDDHILNKLPANDPRVNFIYDRLKKLNNSLSFHKSGIKIFRGNVLEIWNQLLLDYKIEEVFF
jgi:deoxyribodipyrimidine photo-lyase